MVRNTESYGCCVAVSGCRTFHNRPQLRGLVSLSAELVAKVAIVRVCLVLSKLEHVSDSQGRWTVSLFKVGGGLQVQSCLGGPESYESDTRIKRAPKECSGVETGMAERRLRSLNTALQTRLARRDAPSASYR
ncbi:hypothetical protein CALVIDRAFT_23990 [Calocera viscosa TUFC12733]|uniref:Uncharacterized protein n=1 Tax=Calocera viscosa (strain TUFC12733) TaxID=1330018 RepID=A0A167P744_CALVF|nr:hypothetical protein CALVIDRAFT_23990 [Calocera viscosa TUFC12733]